MAKIIGGGQLDIFEGRQSAKARNDGRGFAVHTGEMCALSFCLEFLRTATERSYPGDWHDAQLGRRSSPTRLCSAKITCIRMYVKGRGMMRRPGRCRPDRAHEERARAPPREKDSLSSLIDDRRMVGRGTNSYGGGYVTEQKRAAGQLPDTAGRRVSRGRAATMIRIGTPPTKTTTTTTNGAMRDRRYTAFLAGKGALRFAHSRVPSKLRPNVKRHRFSSTARCGKANVDRTMGRTVRHDSFGLFQIIDGWIDRFCSVLTETTTNTPSRMSLRGRRNCFWRKVFQLIFFTNRSCEKKQQFLLIEDLVKGSENDLSFMILRVGRK